MDFQLDATPAIDPIVRWANIAPYEDSRKPWRGPFEASIVGTNASGAPEFFVAKPGLYSQTVSMERPQQRSADWQSAVRGRADTVSVNSDVDAIAKQRVQLLAAKYAKTAQSSEVLARLEILNSRMLDRSPRVTRQQVEALENVIDQIANAEAARKERAKRLGLRA